MERGIELSPMARGPSTTLFDACQEVNDLFWLFTRLFCFHLLAEIHVYTCAPQEQMLLCTSVCYVSSKKDATIGVFLSKCLSKVT
jgi:hypothetical protein